MKVTHAVVKTALTYHLFSKRTIKVSGILIRSRREGNKTKSLFGFKSNIIYILLYILINYYMNLVDCDKIALNHIHLAIIFIDVIK